MKRKNIIVPAFFLALGIGSFLLSGRSLTFLFTEIYARFGRNILFVLALILPILCGMGINFAIIVGAISTQIAVVIAIDLGVTGASGFLFIFGMTTVIASLLGMLIANLLNKARGKEMIVSIVVGLLASSLYQFLFMVCYGLFFQPRNPAILLDRGIGVRSILDAQFLGNFVDGILPFTVESKVLSLFPILFAIAGIAATYYLQRTRLGYHAKAVGSSEAVAEKLGIRTDRVRKFAIITSTLLAAYSQILFIADFGTVNVYTGHMGMETFAAASILVGGATLKKANIGNAILGVILFHTLFVTSPMAGQNLFNNPAVGEYFRSFIAYATILIALVLNMRHEKKEKFESKLHAPTGN